MSDRGKGSCSEQAKYFFEPVVISLFDLVAAFDSAPASYTFDKKSHSYIHEQEVFHTNL